jgi:hypothetical protein
MAHGEDYVTRRRPYSRHGLNAAMARISLRSFKAIDRRTVAARGMLAFRDELVSALGGEGALSPQRRKLVDLAARASLYLDHLDAWLGGQRSLIRQRAVAPRARTSSVSYSVRGSPTTSPSSWTSSVSIESRGRFRPSTNT